MATLWGAKLWNTFRWGYGEEFDALLDQKTGATVVRRIIWELDAGNQDITEYFVEGSAISQEKERAPDRIVAGDATLIFNNSSGVFTETSSTSFLYNVKYHNRNITFEVGFELADGTFQYAKVATMRARAVDFSSDNSRVTIRVYDMVSRLLTETINRRPATMVPVAGGSNVGNGTVTDIDTKPFVTVAENWTLTCTLGGADGVATFSVVGSVSGALAAATSGTEFLNATTGGIKFTIRAGATNWAIGDAFTFSTVQMMEWSALNPVKVIWSILTGYNYDTAVAEGWLTRTPQLSATKTASNADINWQALVNAIDESQFTIKGFIPWDYSLTDALEEIVVLFLGSINIDVRGRLFVKWFKPSYGSVKNFSDAKKVSSLSYRRDMQDMINWCSVKYRKTDAWPWTDEDEEETFDGLYVASNQTSHDDYEQWFSLNATSRWYNSAGTHVAYMADRIVDKYSQPPKRFMITTGMDGLDIEIGDVVTITDDKSGHTAHPVEIVKKDGEYASLPRHIVMEAEDTGTAGFTWGFMGSSADESDGVSPQAADWDSATVNDKTFAYMSQDGATSDPRYYMW